MHGWKKFQNRKKIVIPMMGLQILDYGWENDTKRIFYPNTVNIFHTNPIFGKLGINFFLCKSVDNTKPDCMIGYPVWSSRHEKRAL